MHRKLALTSLETSYPVPGSNKEALTRTGSLITEAPHPRLSILKSSIKNTVTSSNTAALPLLFYIPPACTRPFEREPPSRALWLCQLTQPVGVGGGRKGVGDGGGVIKRLHSGTHSQIHSSQLGAPCRRQGCHWSKPLSRKNDF